MMMIAVVVIVIFFRAARLRTDAWNFISYPTEYAGGTNYSPNTWRLHVAGGSFSTYHPLRYVVRQAWLACEETQVSLSSYERVLFPAFVCLVSMYRPRYPADR